jgi:RNA polymerase sigma-70 factor (ECF subfamily)
MAAIESRHGASQPSLTPGQLDPERTVAQREIQLLLERAIDRLPAPFRTVLVMRLVEGMSVHETAEALAIRSETVKTRLHRARSLLRKELEGALGPSLIDTFPFEGERCERMTERVLERLDASQ